jgi:tRNA (Thr-GGU) A37 N-methylase
MKQDKKCSMCGRVVDRRRVFEVDGHSLCSACIYGDAEPFEIFPVGVVRKPAFTGDTSDGEDWDGDASRIELLSSQERFLYRVDEEKYLTIVYYLHRSGPVKSVFTRGLDGKKTGLFATRTPHRLSKIAIQDVRVIKVEGTTLTVGGLDAIDGSPVLDIKLRWSSIK